MTVPLPSAGENLATWVARFRGAYSRDQVALKLPTKPDASETAAGTTQGTAYQIISTYTELTAVAANTGVVLPSNVAAGSRYTVTNAGANPLKVYPQSGGSIEALGTNNPYTLAAGKTMDLLTPDGTRWRTIISA